MDSGRLLGHVRRESTEDSGRRFGPLWREGTFDSGSWQREGTDDSRRLLCPSQREGTDDIRRRRSPLQCEDIDDSRTRFRSFRREGTDDSILSGVRHRHNSMPILCRRNAKNDVFPGHRLMHSRQPSPRDDNLACHHDEFSSGLDVSRFIGEHGHHLRSKVVGTEPNHQWKSPLHHDKFKIGTCVSGNPKSNVLVASDILRIRHSLQQQDLYVSVANGGVSHSPQQTPRVGNTERRLGPHARRSPVRSLRRHRS